MEISNRKTICENKKKTDLDLESKKVKTVQKCPFINVISKENIIALGLHTQQKKTIQKLLF